MTMEQAWGAAIDSLYAVHGVAGVHVDGDENETSIKLIPEYDLDRYGGALEVSGRFVVVSVRKSQLALSPLRGDKYKFNGVTYTVDTVLREDEIEHSALAT